MRQRFGPILPVLFALLLALPAAQAATVNVSASGFSFVPQVVDINVGDTVVWSGLGGGFHNVVAEDGSFRSLEGPDTFSHTFNSAGSFDYICEPHVSFGMVGTVNVSGGGGGGNKPTAPANLQADVHSATEILLAWTDASGETGYRIERKALGGAFEEVATAPANATSATLGGLAPATFYAFRVRAQNAAGLSGYSNEASAVTRATPGVCVESSTTLCLAGGRFQAELDWRPGTEPFRPATAVPLEFAPESGLFYFLSPGNIEMLVKVLNACDPVLGSRYWVFYAATTNVELILTVIDTQTTAVQVYHNPLNNPAEPVQDTDAFATCP